MSNIDVVFASGPTYLSTGGTPTNFLLPFTYSGGTLDLPAGSYSNGTSSDPIGNAGVCVRLLGGNSPILSLGNNFKNFIKSKTWGTYTIPSSATITIASAGNVTRVQQLNSKFLASSWDQKAYTVAAGTWDGANFIGPPAVYLFTKPLVVQINNPNICITFQTYWDH